MVFLQFEDESGTIEVTIRAHTYEKVAPLIADGALILVRGRTEVRAARRDPEEEGEAPKEEVKVTAEEVVCLEALAQSRKKVQTRRPGVHIRVQMFQSDFMAQLRDTLLRHRGDQEVYLHLVSPQGETIMALAESFHVRDTEELSLSVTRLLGRESIWAEAS